VFDPTEAVPPLGVPFLKQDEGVAAVAAGTGFRVRPVIAEDWVRSGQCFSTPQ